MIIDQFIMSGEDKWGAVSDLVLLLPHGFEGQGPEHSSARLERFLQGCAEDNVVVANMSTPARIFLRLWAKLRVLTKPPLIVMAPKSLPCDINYAFRSSGIHPRSISGIHSDPHP